MKNPLISDVDRTPHLFFVFFYRLLLLPFSDLCPMITLTGTTAFLHQTVALITKWLKEIPFPALPYMNKIYSLPIHWYKT